MSLDLIQKTVRDIPDFPQPGILFKDITPVLANPDIFNQSIELMADKLRPEKIDKIVGLDARGFIFGSALALKLGIGFIPVRKPGKLPAATISESYELEYGSNTLEIHQDALQKNERVAVIDDLLATGGTAEASGKLIEQLGAEVISYNFFMEISFLKGSEKLQNAKVNSLIIV